MADATLQILGLGTGAVPLDYPVTGNQALDLIAVKADFDGSGSFVDFVPVVEILSDAGELMAQAKGPTVTAGDSATVTFAPFLRSDGIQEITSADASVTVVDPFGPVTDLSASGGGITQITSADSSVTITNPFGPNTNLAVPRPTTGTEILADTGEPLTAGSSYQFGWTASSGPTLVNLAISQRLKVTTAGWYGFRGRVNSGDAMADGDVWRLFMSFWTAAAAGIDTAVQVLAAPTAMFPDVFIQGVSYLPVNGFVTLDIQNQSAVTDFTVSASMAVNWLNR